MHAYTVESEDRVYPQILTGQSVSIIMTPTSDVAACIIYKHALLKKKKLKTIMDIHCACYSIFTVHVMVYLVYRGTEKKINGYKFSC